MVSALTTTLLFKVNLKTDISNSSFVQFQVWDFPGQLDFFDPSFDTELIFGSAGALIFVIDAQVSVLMGKKTILSHPISSG